LIEEHALFSRSRLWDLQRAYFEGQGIDAWRQGEVPYYITTNPTMARTYAEIVFGFFRDRAALSPSTSDPIYLVELGAGSGHLAHHLLLRLAELCERVAFPVPAYRYVLTDLAAKNLDFWQQHPRLQPLMEQGVLDVALYDAERDDGLHLQVSGQTLRAHSVRQPIVVIANYFFDSIPQDLFYVDGGQLYECRVTLRSDLDPEQASAAELLQDIQVEYEGYPVDLPYYGEEALDELLAEYRPAFTGTHVLFPHTGLRCLSRLRALSQEGAMLLSADKGYHRLESLQGQRPPGLVRHGSFSLSVNYHAFKRFCERQGGAALFTGHHHYSLNIACLQLLPQSDRYAETRLAYARFVEDFGPDDFYSLKKHFERLVSSMSMRDILAHLRLSNYDVRLLQEFGNRLYDLLPDSEETERLDMVDAIDKAWERYFPIGEEQDLAFNLGMLLYQMDAYRKALLYFDRSIAAYGPSPATWYNMAACYFQLQDRPAALALLDQILAQDPNHEAARELRTHIRKH
jgi:tetratricopeptide (TPR) repeat protein